MLNSLWKLTAVVTQAGNILGITDQDLASGIEETLTSSAGSVDNEMCAIAEQKPIISFSTTQLAAALTICGLDGYSLGGATDFYFAKYALAGAVDSTSVHMKVSISIGMMVCKSLEASQGKTPAKLSYEIHALSSDGKTSPFTISTAQALPSFAVNVDAWTLGPVELNSGGIAGVQSVKWDFGIRPEVMGSEGLPYPTFAAICGRTTRCAVNGPDISGIATSGASGFGLGGTSLTSFKTFFRKFAVAGTRIIDATASHIKLSGTAGMLYPRGFKGTDGKPYEGDWNVQPVYDGTNDVVAISTGSAVT